jgi:hypothetical protein
MSRITTALCLTVLVFVTGVCLADIPKLINYQGMLTDDEGNPLTGSYNLTFYIYDDTTGGNLEWSETQNGVQVENGLFNVILGKQATLNLSFDESYWLAVKVGTETMPRVRITSVGYAYRAFIADSALVAGSGSGSNWSVGNSVLYTNSYWGIARGGAGNALYGSNAHTMVNLGVECTTGTSGQNYYYSTVSGGFRNRASANYATVSGGAENIASDQYATVGGGLQNTANSLEATVGGGYHNEATGKWATIPGGYDNTAGGDFSFAAGRKARANHHASFVWADTTGGDFNSTGVNTFNVRATGGSYFISNSTDYGARFENLGNGDGIRVYGHCSAGATNWGAIWAHNDGTSPTIYASNVGGGNAAHFDGDVDVSDNQVKNYYGFPKPNYDSGWRTVSAGNDTTLNHNIGGNEDDYVIQLWFRDYETEGKHNCGIGGWENSPYATYQGAYWHGLTNSQIKIYRHSDDYFVDQFRVRIWVIQ